MSVTNRTTKPSNRSNTPMHQTTIHTHTRTQAFAGSSTRHARQLRRRASYQKAAEEDLLSPSDGLGASTGSDALSWHAEAARKERELVEQETATQQQSCADTRNEEDPCTAEPGQPGDTRNSSPESRNGATEENGGSIQDRGALATDSLYCGNIDGTAHRDDWDAVVSGTQADDRKRADNDVGSAVPSACSGVIVSLGEPVKRALHLHSSLQQDKISIYQQRGSDGGGSDEVDGNVGHTNGVLSSSNGDFCINGVTNGATVGHVTEHEAIHVKSVRERPESASMHGSGVGAVDVDVSSASTQGTQQITATESPDVVAAGDVHVNVNVNLNVVGDTDRVTAARTEAQVAHATHTPSHNPHSTNFPQGNLTSEILTSGEDATAQDLSHGDQARDARDSGVITDGGEQEECLRAGIDQVTSQEANISGELGGVGDAQGGRSPGGMCVVEAADAGGEKSGKYHKKIIDLLQKNR
jgi:hypothetical protein